MELAGFYLTPAVFTDVTPRMRIAREEIFGPVLAILPFSTEEECVRMANDTVYGLSGSIWTHDLGRALRVARRVRTGVLSVNGSSACTRSPSTPRSRTSTSPSGEPKGVS